MEQGKAAILACMLEGGSGSMSRAALCACCGREMPALCRMAIRSTPCSCATTGAPLGAGTRCMLLATPACPSGRLGATETAGLGQRYAGVLQDSHQIQACQLRWGCCALPAACLRLHQPARQACTTSPQLCRKSVSWPAAMHGINTSKVLAGMPPNHCKQEDAHHGREKAVWAQARP